ncbi:MAG: 5-formyltetrahydrofolate cyclo-ligase [Clostridia bacterium]|nr:5-formyltetrahydrofolate cyclo-ligase [Clostridia bacterium]
MVKDILRAEFRTLRDSIPEAERFACSAQLVKLIRSLPEYKAARLVMLYFPIGSEPDILPLAEAASADGKLTAFPVTRGGVMSFCIAGASDCVCSGGMGIPEPDEADCELVSEFSDAICVVPALAVDKLGRRLGYGGGYYDRFLKRFTGFSVCAVFPQLFISELRAEPHDVPVASAAVAGSGIIRFK